MVLGSTDLVVAYRVPSLVIMTDQEFPWRQVLWC